MIQANELRIGNWVLFDIEEVYEQITTRRLGFIAQANSKGHSHPFKPILLTEEILLKCGLKKDSTNGTYWIDLQTHYLELNLMPDGCYPTYAQYPELSHESEQRVNFSRIESVHQLQNLFYSLTQNELEVKL